MTKIEKTRCPHCKSAFRVTAAQLTAARGMVRCGVCFRTFNASEHLETDSPPVANAPADDDILIDDDFDLSRLSELSESTTSDDRIAADLHPAMAPSRQNTVKMARKSAVQAEDILHSIPLSDETELDIDGEEMAAWREESVSLIGSPPQSEVSPKSRRNGLWLLGTSIAVTAFLLQLLYFNSLQVKRESTLWSIAQPLCSVLGCPLQAPTDISRIVTGDLLIRTHPTVANALFVDAILVNQAKFSQPFPRLRLIFENLQGETVAYRIFSPAEYLGGELAHATLIPPKRPVKLELEIVDPGKDAVSFRLLVEK